MWTLTCVLLIPHPREPRLLAHVEGDAWRLPVVTLRAEGWMDDTRLLRAVVRAELGADVTVLRRIHLASDDDARTALAAYDLEVQDGAWRPAGGGWLGVADIGSLSPADERVAGTVAARLGEAAGGQPPALRSSWARPGWYAGAMGWAEGELRSLGRRVTGQPVQHQLSGISCVLRIPTDAGDVFFKEAAALPLFCDEPRLLRWLAARAPDLVPSPLAVEPARRWMLLDDAGSPLWDDAPDATWVQLATRHARLQRALVGDVPALLAVGCPDRRLERLPEHLDVLLGQAALVAEVRGLLARAMPRVRAVAAELAALGLPQTLTHADLHGGNVVRRGARLAVIDWTDACVSHPFFDLLTLAEHGATPERLRPDLHAAYLAEWRDLADAAGAARAWALAQPLAALHQAVSYHGIISGIEPVEHPLFADDLPYFIRRGVELLDALG